MKIDLFDTTLRDGAQTPGISFGIEDKLRIIQALDEFGMDFIEAGNPGSNPKDLELFERAARLNLKNAKLVAFGPTCRAGVKASEDESLQKLIQAGTDYIVIFGKSWLLHVEKIIQTDAEENLRIIFDSIKFLRDNNKKVFFDAEHFFDGYSDNKDYALQVLRTAGTAGAEVIILCDTNGGNMPDKIGGIVSEARKTAGDAIPRLGIHCHNDTGLSVASTIEAVKNGAVHIQGAINGLGERCGNADMCVLIPNLQLKLKYDCVPPENLRNLTGLARLIADISNTAFNERTAYVGGHAFTHKAGMHVDAVNKLPASFEHIRPELVGNVRDTLISEISGRAALLNRMKLFAPDISKSAPELQKVLAHIKSRENEGYQFENAEGSLDLIILEVLGRYRKFFEVEGFKVDIPEPFMGNKAGAQIKISVGGRESETAEAEGSGPVNALDIALRTALSRFFPALENMRLIDYKVRVLNSGEATAAKVRVLIESSDNIHVWRTVGVSTDIIEASWKALLDSVGYKLSLDAGLVTIESCGYE